MVYWSITRDNTVSVFPNPANNVLDISLEETLLNKSIKVSICEPLGKVVLEEFTSTGALRLNIEHLSKGIYFLNISESGSVIASKKIIKE